MAKVLSEVGIKADPTQLHALMEALKGKKLHELIAAGLKKIQTVAVAGTRLPSSHPQPPLPLMKPLTKPLASTRPRTRARRRARRRPRRTARTRARRRARRSPRKSKKSKRKLPLLLRRRPRRCLKAGSIFSESPTKLGRC